MEDRIWEIGYGDIGYGRSDVGGGRWEMEGNNERHERHERAERQDKGGAPGESSRRAYGVQDWKFGGGRWFGKVTTKGTKRHGMVGIGRGAPGEQAALRGRRWGISKMEEGYRIWEVEDGMWKMGDGLVWEGNNERHEKHGMGVRD